MSEARMLYKLTTVSIHANAWNLYDNVTLNLKFKVASPIMVNLFTFGFTLTKRFWLLIQRLWSNNPILNT